jgi:hypothetical protein
MDDFITVTATGVQRASGASSAGGTLPLASSGEVPRYIRVAATAPACIKIGPGTQTATAGDLQVQPGDTAILAVPRGCTNYAVIQVSNAGIVQISPLEDC